MKGAGRCLIDSRLHTYVRAADDDKTEGLELLAHFKSQGGQQQQQQHQDEENTPSRDPVSFFPPSLSETNSHHPKGALPWLLMIQKKQSLGVIDLEIDPAAINPVNNKETWDVCTVE